MRKFKTLLQESGYSQSVLEEADMYGLRDEVIEAAYDKWKEGAELEDAIRDAAYDFEIELL
jgi:hypothetical protein